jgi:hypothetical protein
VFCFEQDFGTSSRLKIEKKATFSGLTSGSGWWQSFN